MKNIALITTMILLLSSCVSYQDYAVESDYSYQGKFKEYKTFAFQNELNLELKKHPMNASIEDAIKKRLELQGYTFNEDNPNLLIAYRLFYDDLKITSYHQPLLENWMRYGNESEEYDPVQLDLKKGTLFVIMRDHEQDNTVWQGYASSVFGNDNFDNDRYIKNVTRSMFDQYRIFAHDNLLADNRKRH